MENTFPVWLGAGLFFGLPGVGWTIGHLSLVFINRKWVWPSLPHAYIFTLIALASIAGIIANGGPVWAVNMTVHHIVETWESAPLKAFGQIFIYSLMLLLGYGCGGPGSLTRFDRK